MSRELSDSVVLVTGGTHGIGLAVAGAFADARAEVFVVGRDRARLDAAVTALAERGHVAGTTGDVSVVADTRRVVDETVETYGRIDVLVNVAGVFAVSIALDVTEQQFDEQFDTNVKGTYFCTQSAARQMLHNAQGGRVINVSSVAAQRGFPGVSAYSASKAAVDQLTRSFAAELAPHGINVNCVVPGNIDMPTNVLMAEPGARETTAAATPARRNGFPADVCQAVLFLASPEADFIHGASLVVDGGLLAAG